MTQQMPTPAPPGRAGAADRSPAELAARARLENFPVALRFIPAHQRDALARIYAFARSVDDLGDEPITADPLAALDEVAAEVTRLTATGHSGLPFVAGLAPLVGRGMPVAPLLDLVEANRADQTVTGYLTWAELRGYCRLSANPVGRLVLWVFGAATPERAEASDSVCTALQVLEHLQDVGEDHARGRRYLPADDMARHQVADSDLGARSASPGLRELISELAWRSRVLLAQGGPLTASLSGAARVAIAGYTGGGLAVLDALARARYDVLAVAARPRRRDTAVRAAGILLAAGRR